MSEIEEVNTVPEVPAVPAPGVERAMDTLIEGARSPSTPLAPEVIEAAMKTAAELKKDTTPKGS